MIFVQNCQKKVINYYQSNLWHHFQKIKMQIKVKTLDKKELIIDVEDTQSVEELKKKIQTAKDNDVALEPSISKLIWKGKILQNNQQIKEAGINDKGFCVIMPGKVAKTVSTPKTENLESKPSDSKPVESKPAESQPTEPKPAENPPQNPTAPTPANPNPPTPTPGSDEDPIMQLQAQLQLSDDLISNIVAVSGMTADKAKLALTVAQGNPDLAVELIMSNNLEPAVNELRRRLLGGAPQTQESSENTGTPDSITSGDRQVVNESNPLHYLTENPMGQQMIAAIRQNPAILPQILQQISQTNPELFQQLQSNHEAFLELLESDGAAMAAPTGGSGTGESAPSGAQRVELQITQQDREAIDRVSIGISKFERCLQGEFGYLKRELLEFSTEN